MWILTASIFVGFILAVGFVVTEKLLVQTFTITARQFAFSANGLVGLEDGLGLAWL